MPPALAALYLIWLGWAISWLVAARWSAPAVARPPAWREWSYRLLTWPGWMLLLAWPIDYLRPLPPGVWRPLWQLPGGLDWTMAGVAAAGCLFAWWGRVHLGRLWSAGLTRKRDHRVVDSGPYGIVRHPIYTGLCMAALATLVLRANPTAALGFALFIAGYWRKAREEERFLASGLCSDAYESYRRRVPMLVPFCAL